MSATEIGQNVQVDIAIEHQSYYPLNTVQGTLTVTVKDTPALFAAIFVNVRGEEDVCIVRALTRGLGSFQHYRDHYTFYRQHILLHDGHGKEGSVSAHNENDESPPFELQPGTHTYIVSFTLPGNLPPSLFVPPHLAVHYECIGVATLHNPKAEDQHKYGHVGSQKVPFAVLSVAPALQLAQRREAHEKKSEVHHIKRFFSNRGQLCANMTLDSSLVTLDNPRVILTAELDNTDDKQDIHGVTISLQRHVSCSARGLNETWASTIWQKKVESTIEAGQQSTVTETIDIAHDMIPSFTGHLVNVHYHIEVELSMSWVTNPKQIFDLEVVHCSSDIAELPDVQFQHPTRSKHQTEEAHIVYPHKHEDSPEGINSSIHRPSVQMNDSVVGVMLRRKEAAEKLKEREKSQPEM